MDELDAARKARVLITEAQLTSIPVDVERLVKHIGGEVRYVTDLSVPGFTVGINGKKIIYIEQADPVVRQRFTICHEVGHIVLDIPTGHDRSNYPLVYTGRSKNEILCDVFAASLLLPDDAFKPLADNGDVDFSSVDRLADHFMASRTAVASRFSAVNFRPCAFVLAEKGVIRFVSYSPTLREAWAWITTGVKLPSGSLAARCRQSAQEGPVKIDPTVWFDDWRRGGTLLEDARHLSRLDQTLALICFEDEDLPPSLEEFNDRSDDTDGLKELDGILPWPDKGRRR